MCPDVADFKGAVISPWTDAVTQNDREYKLISPFATVISQKGLGRD